MYKPLLEATGGKGMYINVNQADETQRQELLELAESYIPNIS